MRYLNKIYGCLTLVLLSVFMLSSCSEDLDVNAPGNDYSTIKDNYGIVRNVAGSDPLYNITVYAGSNASAQVYYELAKATTEATTITFTVSQEVLDAYNQANNTSYQMYPSDLISFDGQGSILANEKKSSNVTMTVKPNTVATNGSVFAIPVTVANDGVKKSAEYIFLVTAKDSRPTTDKGVGNKQVMYIEVNNESLLNVGEYTVASTGRPFFDMVYIFAANINFNTVTGKMYINCNENVQYILDNADRIIRPLQEKGIKVGLSILGNWDGTGVANLTDETAKDFAKEIKNYIEAYGLDGVNFDDEWSDYGSKKPNALGLITDEPSGDAYGRLIYETRQLLPNKLITVYEIGYTPDQSTAVDGTYIKDIVDYCYQPYYGSFASSSYVGVPNSQYFGLAVDCNSTLWALNYINQTKENGHAGVMYYNLKSSNAEETANYLNYYVGGELLNDQVVWSGKTYSQKDLK